MARHTTLVALAVVAALLGTCWGFKADEFKNCDDSAFCKRLRGTTGGEAYVLLPESVQVDGARVTATVQNTENANGTFYLVLTAYGDTLRLFVNESPEKGRWQVPDVLLPGLEGRQQAWEVVKKSHTKLRLRMGAAEAELRTSPAQLEVSVGGEPALVWNGGKQFVFEHLREKQEGDPEGWWGESFKSHHDSKPKGPAAISFDLQFPGTQHLYGIPERASDLALRPTTGPDGPLSEPYRLYNLDVFEYLDDSPFGLYGSIPFLLAHRAAHSLGVFWLNAAEMFVDVSQDAAGSSTHWFAESGVLDLFVFVGPGPSDVARQFAALTGGAALPQMFSLGYHQCRWNYKDEPDVAAVDGGFDAHNIPYDVLWLDIEHTDGKRYFTWDGTYFPTPARMQEDLASRGRKMVTIVDPHIKRDPNWRVFKEAEESRLYVQNKEGADFDGWCWPGSSSYLDMVAPAVRDWWSAQFSTSLYQGSTKHLYIWNDMNEPSVFNGPEITMHKDNLHLNGTAEHRDVHNVYGYFYHMATADGLRKRGFEEWGADGDRPFVLSRAFFAGTQRIGAIWTGDNEATWSHLKVSVPMLLACNIANLPFSGADIGGFFGNPEPELLVRWYQVAAFYPFMRGHAHLEAKRREPWLFGEENTARMRAAIRQRYALLPYLYTQFLLANGSGAPIMRPLFYDFPAEADVFALQHTFMLGSSLLVAPVLDQGASEVQVVLPGGGLWYDNIDGTVIDSAVPAHRNFSAPAPLDVIRSYLRGGTMLPLKERPRRSSAQMASDPITLVIALDRQGQAAGQLYVDDGRSYAFQRGAYAYRSFAFSADGVLSSTAADHAAMQLSAAPLPDFDPAAVIDRVVVLGLAGGPSAWRATLLGPGGEQQRQLEAAPGPLYNQAGLGEVALVVRKAGLSLAADWSVAFAPASGSGGSVS